MKDCLQKHEQLMGGYATRVTQPGDFSPLKFPPREAELSSALFYEP